MTRRRRDRPGAAEAGAHARDRRAPETGAHAPRTEAPRRPDATRTSLAIALLAVIACLGVSLAYRIPDVEIWEHLAIGRAIVALRHVPHARLWTWPAYGMPEVDPRWGFQVLSWLAWRLGGLAGLYAGGWIAAAIAFALVWRTARLLGARGHAPLLVIALALLTWRQRAIGRPEALAAMLLALEILLLELHRQRGRATLRWVPLVLWIWVNVHVTWVVCVALLALYALADLLAGGSRQARRTRRSRALLLLGAVALALLLNPFGSAMLAEPFRLALAVRSGQAAPGALVPLDWKLNLRNGLPVLLVLWPALQVWRATRRRFDPLEAALCAGMTLLVLIAGRLAGAWVVVASPFLARGLAEWLGTRTFPGWLAPAPARSAAVALAAVGLSIPEWTRPGIAPGFGFAAGTTPAAACDFIEAHALRGRAFNHSEFGSYMAYRFWPDRDRLPFVDASLAGEPGFGSLYAAAIESGYGWRQLDRRYHFDFALLHRPRTGSDVLATVLDGDSTWSLVFTDDDANLYVRNGGAHRALADSAGYRLLGGGLTRLRRTWTAAEADPLMRGRFVRELERMMRESPACSNAHSWLAYAAAFEGRYGDAEREIRRAHAIAADLPLYHDRLGFILMSEGRLDEALKEFGIARRRKESVYTDYEMGLTYLKKGDERRAREAFSRSMTRVPGFAAAADSVRAIDARRRAR